MARRISNDFKKAFENGVLSGIIKEIRSNNEYIICFRDESINVYYRGHSLVFVKKVEGKGYYVSFNLGHARYYKDYFEVINELKDLRIGGMRIVVTLNNNDDKMKQNYSVEFYVNGRNATKIDFSQIMKLFRKYIDDFCIGGKRYDYFERETCSSKVLREKKHQQVLFMEHQNLQEKSGLFFYDMELSLPKPKEKSEEYKIVKQEIGTHITCAPDCLAVRVENGTVTNIVLVEVKSTQKACVGDNGIYKHDKDFNNIIKCSYYRKFIVESMKETLSLYAKYGLCEEITIPEHLGDVKEDFEILYFFTHDDVIKWTKNSGEDNKDNMKKYKELYSQAPNMFVDWSSKMKSLLGKNYD